MCKINIRIINKLSLRGIKSLSNNHFLYWHKHFTTSPQLRKEDSDLSILDAEQLDFNRQPLGEQSYVTRGTAYEVSVMGCFEKYGLNSTRTGKAGDHGIDFRGFWKLAPTAQIRVVGQCKREIKRTQPNRVRELESVVLNEASKTLGILISSYGFTDPSVKAMFSSSLPLAFATLPCLTREIDSPVEIEDFLFNQHASKLFQHKLLAIPIQTGFDSGKRKKVQSDRVIFTYDGIQLKLNNRI